MPGGSNTFDFIVIGSGFGGSVCAYRLAEKGYSVAVIEAGRRYKDQDYPKSNWNIFRSIWFPLLRCFGLLRINFLSDVMILSWAGVGGGSLGYAGTLLEAPDAFFKNPQWAGITDWKAVLAPHYRTARRMLGVCQLKELSPADEIIKAMAEDLNCSDTFRLQDVGVFLGEPQKTVPDPYFGGRGPERTGCRYCGGCMVGCRYNAKNTLVKNYLYLAEQLGVRVFSETTAKLIRVAEDGGYRIDTVSSRSVFKCRQHTFKASRLVLSAGVLGTLSLLMRCQAKGSLPRLSPMLGCRVRTNSESLTGATAREKSVDYSKGVAITSSIHTDKVTHIEPVRYPIGSDLLGFLVATRFIENAPAWQRRLKWFAGIFRHPLDSLSSIWPFGWARRTIILLIMQTVDNSLRVYRKRRWWWPFYSGLASRREQGCEKVPVCIPQAQAATKILADKIDGVPQNAINEVLFNVGTTAHILGGCVIGPNASKGVIDDRNRVFGYEGLYVVDGSMLPANLGVNPSLTITAMAEYAMSHIPPQNRVESQAHTDKSQRNG